MERSWHDQPPSLRREGWIKTFCVPLARRRFARKMQRTLEWNPIAWLQQYSWKARVSKWGLCLGLVMIECVLTTGNPSEMMDAQSVMMLILAAVFTFVGVNSFLTEKKSGALELLLVTPVTPNQIIWGRVWGLWKQFLPAGLTLLALSLFADYLRSMSNWPTGTLWQYAWSHPEDKGIIWTVLTWPLGLGRNSDFYELWASLSRRDYMDSGLKIFVTAMGFLTLPVFATYFALRVKNLIVAAVLTWLALFLCPYFAFSAHAFVSNFISGLTVEDLYAGVFLSNLGFALLACFLLSHSLSRRIYSF
jgi:hypothetical protein